MHKAIFRMYQGNEWFLVITFGALFACRIFILILTTCKFLSIMYKFCRRGVLSRKREINYINPFWYFIVVHFFLFIFCNSQVKEKKEQMMSRVILFYVNLNQNENAYGSNKKELWSLLSEWTSNHALNTKHITLLQSHFI